MTQLPGPLYRLVWGGPINVNETWSCSVSCVGLTNVLPVARAVDFVPAISDWFVRPSTKIMSQARLDFVKFNQLRRVTTSATEKQGQYMLPTSDTHLINPVILPPGGADNDPPQLTQAVTLRTELARGRGSTGRFYPPSYSHATLGGDGRQDVTMTRQMADSAQELISEINGVLTAGITTTDRLLVAIYSAVGNIAFDVQRVSVGRVVDTQRRRRNSLDEDPQFALASV